MHVSKARVVPRTQILKSVIEDTNITRAILPSQWICGAHAIIKQLQFDDKFAPVV